MVQHTIKDILLCTERHNQIRNNSSSCITQVTDFLTISSFVLLIILCMHLTGMVLVDGLGFGL